MPPGPQRAAAAGWYADPFARHAKRYWDGSSWTDRVLDGITERIDAPGERPPPNTAAYRALAYLGLAPSPNGTARRAFDPVIIIILFAGAANGLWPHQRWPILAVELAFVMIYGYLTRRQQRSKTTP